MAAERKEAMASTQQRFLTIAVDWDLFRRSDGTIDLEKAFIYYFPIEQVKGWHETKDATVGRMFLEERYNESISYLKLVESIQLIRSRQTAAVALAMARMHV